MKFTEEQAREALRAELTNKGRKTLHMSEQTLAGQTAFLMKNLANEDTGLPEFVASAIESLNIIEGGARKKDSDHAKYRESHPDPKDNDDPEPPKPTDNPEMQKLLERIAALEKDKEESRKRTSIERKRKDVAAKLREKGVKDEEWLTDFLSEVNVTEDMDVDAKADKWLKVYNRSKANGGNPVPPKNAAGGGDVSDQYKSSITAAVELAKKQQGIIETKQN